MGDHAGGKKVFFHRALGRPIVDADLVPVLYVGLGLAEYVALVRRQRRRCLPGAVVPPALAGFQSSAIGAARRRLVGLGRWLANVHGASSTRRHGIHVGHELRIVDPASFLFPSRLAFRPSVGPVHSRL